jgi:hypothetical protein
MYMNNRYEHRLRTSTNVRVSPLVTELESLGDDGFSFSRPSWHSDLARRA